MRFSLHQLTSVFQIRDQHGLPYILIGGQAVNYWAERFIDVEPELSQFKPFTSVDIDFLGNRDDVTIIARQLGVRNERLPHYFDITALSGVIPVPVENGTVDVEVVRDVYGLNPATIQKSAIHAQWKNLKIRVLDPVSLLHAKAKLALLISQKERRDVDHIKILVYCVRAFLREAIHAAEQNPDLVRGWLGAAEKTLTLTESTIGARLSKRFAINWRDVLPLKEIEATPLPKIIQFRQTRIPAWKQKVFSK